MTNLERIALRMARLLLEGKRVAHPKVRQLNGTLTFAAAAELEPGEGLQHALTAPAGTLSLRVGCPDLVITLGHRELSLGEAIFAIEHGEVRKQVKTPPGPNGEASEAILAIAVPQAERFDCYLLDRIGDEHPSITTPWDLPGINEAAHLPAR